MLCKKPHCFGFVVLVVKTYKVMSKVTRFDVPIALARLVGLFFFI